MIRCTFAAMFFKRNVPFLLKSTLIYGSFIAKMRLFGICSINY